MLLIALAGCVGGNKIQISLKNPILSDIKNASVANVRIVNNQIIITGANLSSVSSLKITDATSTTSLQIESKTSNSIMANTLSNVSFAAGKVFDLVLSNAQASATFAVNFSLCDSSFAGKGFDCSVTPNDKDILSYDQASGKWKAQTFNLSGMTYIGAHDASASIAPTGAAAAGEYWVITVAGTINSVSYAVGDWIVFGGGSTWDKVSNAAAVTAANSKLPLAGGNLTGALQMNAQNELRFADSGSTNYVGFKAPATVASNLVWTLPTADGTSNQVLTTNGLGILSWSTPVGPANTDSLTEGTTNLYFTNARAVSALTTTLSGYATTASIAGKEAAITAGTSSQYLKGDKTLGTFANDVWATVLTGLSTATNSAITASDSVLVAFGKLQAQITGHSTSLATDASNIFQLQTDVTSLNTSVAAKLPLAGGTLTGNLTVNTNLLLKDSTTNYVTVKANAATTAYNFILPANAGTTGQVLKTDGSGNLSWYSIPGAIANTDALTEGTTNLYFTNARAVTALGATLAGYATTATVAGKEPIITAGTTSQYYRGDKSWQTLGSDIVTEGSTNLYYTTARANAKADLSNMAQSIVASALTVTTLNGATVPDFTTFETQSAATTALGLKLDKTGGTLTGNLTVNTNLLLKDSTTNYVTVKANAATTSYNFILPGTAGTSGQVLQTDGIGNLSWVTTSGGGLASTDGLTEGSTNLYFTGTRALATQITAPTLTNAAIATNDTIQIALGKLQAEINNELNVLLAGLSTATNSAIVAGDSIIVAFGKLQAQVSGHSTSLATDASNIFQLQTDVTGLNTSVAAKLPLSGGNLTADVQMNAQHALKLSDTGSTNYVAIRAPASVTTSYTLNMPAAQGAASTVLTNDGAGNLTWEAAASGGGGGNVNIGAGTGTSLVVTGTIDGLSNVTTTTTATNAVEVPEKMNIYYFNNFATAATAVGYTLPSAVAGKQRCYSHYIGQTGVLTITAAASQYIIYSGVATIAGGSVTSGGALGDAACFVGVDSTHWMMYVNNGTWATH